MLSIFHLVELYFLVLLVIHSPTTGQPKDEEPTITSLYIRSDIAYRWATTVVTSVLSNNATTATLATFHIVLPNSAFISAFSMVIENVTYPGIVKDKDTAKEEFEKAVARGESAGHVKQNTRESNEFSVSVNVAAGTDVEFTLTYQELLKRTLGVYQHLININPGQIVPNMRIDVYLRESRNITHLSVPPLKEKVTDKVDFDKVNPFVNISRMSDTDALIVFTPSVKQQEEASKLGLQGQLIIQYDVERDFGGGEIHVVNGYFVHFIAPSGLEPLPKDIVFVLDSSGSMSGNKIQQLKQAMGLILTDLREEDRFNIIEFDSIVKVWQPGTMLLANDNNKRLAMDYVDNILANGGTNINDALKEAIDVLNNIEYDTSRPAIIVFLTDGLPTVGVTNTDSIRENILKANEGQYSLYSLAFGKDTDFEFLKKMSLQNNGFARKIYEDSDAVLQLENFYKEISTPVLSDVEIVYLNKAVEQNSLTTHTFRVYFHGGEIVVCGRLVDGRSSPRLTAEVKAEGKGGKMSWIVEESPTITIWPPPWSPCWPPRPCRPCWPPHPCRPCWPPYPCPPCPPCPPRPTTTTTPPVIDNSTEAGLARFTERLWAYLSIKQLLDEAAKAINETAAVLLNDRALELALKYSFVTPLTSMVVTKPNDTAERTDPSDSDDDDDDDVRRIIAGPKFPQGGSTSPKGGSKSPQGGSKKSKSRRPFGVSVGGGGRPPVPKPGYVIIVNFDLRNDSLCINLDSMNGKVIRLLEDKNPKLLVNAKVRVTNQRTWLSNIGIIIRKVKVLLTPSGIKLLGMAPNPMTWNTSYPRVIVPGVTNTYIELTNGIFSISTSTRKLSIQTMSKYLYLGFEGYDKNVKKLGGVFGYFAKGSWKTKGNVIRFYAPGKGHGRLKTRVPVHMSNVIPLARWPFLRLGAGQTYKCLMPNNPADLRGFKLSNFMVPRVQYKGKLP